MLIKDGVSEMRGDGERDERQESSRVRCRKSYGSRFIYPMQRAHLPHQHISDNAIGHCATVAQHGVCDVIVSTN